jgi:hypothetical protein
VKNKLQNAIILSRLVLFEMFITMYQSQLSAENFLMAGLMHIPF